MGRQLFGLAGVVLMAAAGCGDGRQLGEAPEERVINVHAGTYRGVGIGDTRDQVAAKLGPGERAGQNAFIAPLAVETGEQRSAVRGVCEVTPPQYGRFGTLRYEEIVFLFDDALSCGWDTVEDGAATQEGVAVGDSLDDARDAYPRLRCSEAEFGEGGLFGGPTKFPYCTGRVAASRFIWFGADPIEAIEMNSRPMR